jgi:hypothetical protein
MRRTRLLAAAAVGSLMLAGPAAAQVILSNLPGTGSGTGTNLGTGTDGADRTKAVGLTMGAESLDFDFLTAQMNNPDPTDNLLSGGIYSNVGGAPGALLAAFDPVAVPAGTVSGLIDITTAAPFTLDAGMDYWFVLDGPTVANSLLWESLSPNAAPTGFEGVTWLGYSFSADGGASWGSSGIYNGVTITAIPAPGTLALLAVAGLARRRQR